MYLMISTYLAPLDEVDKARAEHFRFVDGLEARKLVVSAGRQDPPVSGVIILAVDTEAEAVALMADDPYVQRGLARYQAVGWQPVRGVLAGWQG